MPIHWRVVLAVAPHDQQRFNTPLDWYTGGGVQRVVASALDNPDHVFLLWIRGLIEWHLCQRHGIATETVEAWMRQREGDEDPAMDPAAPHFFEHLVADEVMERLAGELGVDPLSIQRAADAATVVRSVP